MTDDDKPQAVVPDTDAQAKPGAEVDSARTEPDLDTLLKQFDTETQPPKGSTETEPATTKPGTGTDHPKTDPRVEALIQREHKREFQADMDRTVKSVQGEIALPFVTPKFVESWIDAEAREDPRLAKAWRDRADNPKQFDQVVQALGKKFAKQFTGLPDANATEDRNLVAAAVRGASTKAPEGKAPDYSKMSNNAFAKDVEEKYGFNPNV